MIDVGALRATWRAEEKVPFAGWDFSYLQSRMKINGPPWSYTEMAMQAMATVRSAVDLETGGGEVLLSMRSRWPERLAATEGYRPNYELAAQRLTPHGVAVHFVNNHAWDRLPFDDGSFDLVLNRHATLQVPEISRIVAPGGTFLTRQVDGRWCHDLEAVFGAKPQWPDNVLSSVSRRIAEETPLTVVVSEKWEGTISFTDVGAVVYYLKAVPWLVPGFTVANCMDELLELHQRLLAGGALQFSAGNFYLHATRPPD